MSRLALLALLSVAGLASSACSRAGNSSADSKNGTVKASSHASRAAGVAQPNADDHAFWKWFSANADKLAATPTLVDAMSTIQHELERAHSGVLAELGSDKATRTLVLTADGDRKLFPLVERLYAARTEVPGWKLVAFRPRQASHPWSRVELHARSLDPESLRFVARPNAGKVDLDVYVPDFREGDRDLGLMVFLSLDHALGEYDVETRVGAIKMHSASDAPKDARAFAALPGEVDTTIAERE